jgi:hypothetical protein
MSDKDADESIQETNPTRGLLIEKEEEGVLTAKKPVKAKDPLCFHCSQPGHMALECNVVLCVYCDSALHKDDEVTLFPCISQPPLCMDCVRKLCYLWISQKRHMYG